MHSPLILGVFRQKPAHCLLRLLGKLQVKMAVQTPDYRKGTSDQLGIMDVKKAVAWQAVVPPEAFRGQASSLLPAARHLLAQQMFIEVIGKGAAQDLGETGARRQNLQRVAMGQNDIGVRVHLKQGRQTQ